MILFPVFCHAPVDDHAPADYSYVRSVNEGRRHAQLQNIHPEPAPEPPISRTAQPVDEYGIPENPFAPQASAQPPVRRSRVARNEAQQVQQPAPPSFAPSQQPQEGAQFAAPVTPEIPDWLKVARQNNYAPNDRPQAPRVQAAPRPSMPQQRTNSTSGWAYRVSSHATASAGFSQSLVTPVNRGP